MIICSNKAICYHSKVGKSQKKPFNLDKTSLEGWLVHCLHNLIYSWSISHILCLWVSLPSSCLHSAKMAQPNGSLVSCGQSTVPPLCSSLLLDKKNDVQKLLDISLPFYLTNYDVLCKYTAI